MFQVVNNMTHLRGSQGQEGTSTPVCTSPFKDQTVKYNHIDHSDSVNTSEKQCFTENSMGSTMLSDFGIAKMEQIMNS